MIGTKIKERLRRQPPTSVSEIKYACNGPGAAPALIPNAEPWINRGIKDVMVIYSLNRFSFPSHSFLIYRLSKSFVSFVDLFKRGMTSKSKPIVWVNMDIEYANKATYNPVML